MKKARFAVAAAAAAALSPAAAQTVDDAETVTLPEVLIEADTRRESPVSEATRSVTVVTSEEIEKQKLFTRNIGDLLSQTTPGFSQSTQAQTDFGQTLRGRTFQTLIDGVPQNTPLRDGRRSLDTIDAEAVERIEIVRGGTAAYGFGAQGGLVNIVTKRPEEGGFSGRARAEIDFSATHPGDSLTYETAVGGSGRVGAIDFLGDAAWVDRGGAFDAEGDRIPADPVGVQGGIADAESLNLLGKVGFNFDDDRQRLQFSGLFYDFEQDSDFTGISFAGDPARDVKTPAVRGDINVVQPSTENFNLAAEYTHEHVLGSALKAQVYYADLEVAYGKFPGLQQTVIDSERIGGRLTVETPVAFDPLPFSVVWGVDVLTDSTAQTGVGDGASIAAPKLDQTAYAGFAQIEVPIFDIAVVTGGVRHETIDVEAPDFTQNGGNVVRGGTLEFDEKVFNVSGAIFLTDRLDLYGG